MGLGTMALCILLCTVHTTQEQGQGTGTGTIGFHTYFPVPVPGPIQCELAIISMSSRQALSPNTTLNTLRVFIGSVTRK